MFLCASLPGAALVNGWELLAGAPTTPLIAACVFLLAGIVKGIVGLGLPTVSMALLALLMTPAEAAALLILPSLVTNVWQIRPWSALGAMWRRLRGMQIGVVGGTLAGAAMFGAPAGAWATASLGAVLMVYSGWNLLGRQVSVSPEAERWLGPVAGAVTGIVTAATGVFVVPAVPYLQALGLSRDELIQAMGISFTLSTIALAAGLMLSDSYSAQGAAMSMVLLLPALAGMAVGQHLRHAMSPQVFRRCFLISLAVLGGYMLWRGVCAL